MEHENNWAGNYKYNAADFHVPETMEQVQEIVAQSAQVKTLGTRHSFNAIADTAGCHISLQKLNRVIGLDRTRHQVTVEGGIRYGELGQYLYANGYALPNLASLPHITVAGACATATHGSGVGIGNLATAVYSMEIVKADGETMVFSRGQQDGDIVEAAVSLGGLGVVTKMTLDVVPAFQMSQTVYEHLPLTTLEQNADAILSGAYSVSLFTNWKEAAFNQVWVKQKVTDETPVQTQPDYFGAGKATAPRHPVPGHTAENCSEQMGVPGPWYERMPHFRLDFVPGAGNELQSEYYVAHRDAYEALCALERVRKEISPHLHVSEVRTIAADDLWMSPCYNQDSVAFHFTWKADWPAVQQVLPIIEKQLAPFQARPHWGKLFAMPPERLQSLFGRLPDFRDLLLRCDPHGKFRNDFLNRYIMES
ncbi:FAD-binding protein [Paenibacillus thalictri]|uniref:FAD-binding protein n=1 Tax=Paenibacillus thalictri TaxID=2527873 RepID=A0A4Q9DXB8_9BACL|nr:FAD-binding protein [Paenibacillus thalictri]TBL81015.1 FAD-binding protein [Paenibacillus thalictri]